ncbi:EF hand family protein [Brugia malayi]|uniref:Bm5305 n=1 Tax=Brugia malayi TaxID=6279 RepID=A0A0K0JIC8_BRUMA|nr:EF hand family protein [Brugia malayi]CRZ25555.1 Bm5305 [Brugia malayi]VIO91551.1 EF hand family protein [Brugia malayi]
MANVDLQCTEASQQTISEYSRRELKEAFSKCDPEGTGTILRSLGFEPRNDEIRILTEKIEGNGKQQKDKVTFRELSNLLSEKLDERNGIREMHAAFELFDSDFKGYITVDDLRRVAGELGETIAEDQLKEMILEADTRGSGNVCEDDFYTVMKKTALY